MQCPKCEYVAAPGEARVDGQCPNCEVFYHKVRQPAQKPDLGVAPTAKTGIRRHLVAALVGIAIFAGACFYGLHSYTHYQLSRSVEVVLRQTNGQLAELLDEKAKRTNAEFLRVYQGRLDDLDKLVAQALSIDDSAAPGVAASTADYVRASREFLKRFADELQSRLVVSGDEASLQVASKFLDTVEGGKFAALSDSEVSALYARSVEQMSGAKDLDARVAELKRGADLEVLGRKRNAYLAAKDTLEQSKSRHTEAMIALGKAGESIGKAGAELESRLGEKLPIQSWNLKH